MKHFTLTQKGIGFRFRNTRAVLLLPGLLAMALLLAAPSSASAQEGFAGTTVVSVVCPSYEEMSALIRTGAALPAWAERIYAYPWDPVNNPDDYDWNPENKVCGYAQFLNIINRDPFYSPDGKWILFDDRFGGVWMVPIEGGEPTLVSDWYMKYHRENGKITSGRSGISQFFGPSPDGKEVLACTSYYDLADGSISQTTGSGSTFISRPIHKIVAGNIETGEERILVKDAFQARWSHSGRWLVYVKRDHDLWIPPSSQYDYFAWEPMITGLFVRDMTTDLEWKITDLAAYPCFNSDDSAVICSMKDGNGLWQIFSIPREGGNPKQITFYGPNDVGRNARITDASPDGQWILHSGDFWVGGVTKTGLCACNIVTGLSYPLFPEATTVNTEGSFSPDGKKIVFSAASPHVEYYSNNDKFSIYVADFNPKEFMKITGVADAAPTGFALAGNYPNPFNPATTIAFTLPSAGPASLTVYDITGRKVRVLVNGPLSAGTHSAVWDGRDERGNAVSSGVYLSRLTQGSNTISHRMLLMK